MDTVRDNYAFQTQTNGLIGGVRIEINNILNTLSPLVIIVEKHNVDILKLESEMELLNSINYLQKAEYLTYAELIQTIDIAIEQGYFNVFQIQF